MNPAITRLRRPALAAGLALAATLAVASPARAGDNGFVDVAVNVTIVADGPDAEAVVEGLTIEFYEDVAPVDGSFSLATSECDPITGTAANEFSYTSDVVACGLDGFTNSEFGIGLDGLPSAWSAGATCTVNGLEPPQERIVDGGAPTFSVDEVFILESVDCDIDLQASSLLIDKVVINDGGGTATASDFEIVVTDSEGVEVASGSDVADATCEADFDTTNCGVITMPSGVGFQITETPVEDYELTSIECDQFVNALSPPDGGVELAPLGDDGFRTDDGDTYCVITNTYVPPATTTTTTTTTTTNTTTTVAATTTTLFDGGGVTLPPTGASSTANTWMAAIALALLGLGGVTIATTRRR